MQTCFRHLRVIRALNDPFTRTSPDDVELHAASMADLQEFEKVLKEVVNAKRLSASKINTLTELCMKLIENDVQLVSLLYRTHKGLPTSQKVFSLYAFDALARAARHAVVKNNITVDPLGTKGNCASFLNKVEGVLDSLIDDMLSSGQKELREKTKKIVDIWTTNNTFSKSMLAGLSAKVKAAEDKAAALSAAPQSTTPPGGPPSNPLLSISPPAGNAAQAAGVQQALLALLSQAAAVKGATPPTNTAPLATVPAAAPAAVAPSAPAVAGLGIEAQRILQQLAGQVQSQTQTTVPVAVPPLIPPTVPAAPSPPPKPMPIYAPNLPPPPDQIAAQRAAAVTQLSPIADNSRFDGRGGPRPSRWGDTRERSPPPRHDRDGRPDDNWDDRGGRGRGRGRGYSDRGGWDRRGRGRERSPPFYGGRERSRSPPYRGPPGGERFDNRGPPGGGRFPPRRDSPVRTRSPPTYRSPPGRDANLMAQSMARTDEFGREVRDVNERPPAKASEEAQPPRSVSGGYTNNGPSSSQASTSSAAPIPSVTTSGGQVGLDKFDWSTFDFSKPESWDALGRAFQVTNGHLPTQEEAMAVVMQRQMGMMGGMMGGPMMGMPTADSNVPASNTFSNPGQPQPAWQNGGDDQYQGGGYRGRGRGRGRGGGRGGFGYGRGGGSGGGDAGWSNSQEQQGYPTSEGVVGWSNAGPFQGGTSNGGQGWGSDTPTINNGFAAPTPASIPTVSMEPTGEEASPTGKRSGGHMVKVGDKWQWVPG